MVALTALKIPFMLQLIRKIRARLAYPKDKVKPLRKVHLKTGLFVTTRLIENIYVIDVEVIRT